MVLWPTLPYELIGKAVVGLSTIVLSLLILGGFLVGILYWWSRVWLWLSNRMWKGYEADDERPPQWKIRISGVALALGKFKFRKIPAAYREASEIADDNVTARDAMYDYLQRVFIDG